MHGAPFRALASAVGGLFNTTAWTPAEEKAILADFAAKGGTADLVWDDRLPGPGYGTALLGAGLFFADNPALGFSQADQVANAVGQNVARVGRTAYDLTLLATGSPWAANAISRYALYQGIKGVYAAGSKYLFPKAPSAGISRANNTSRAGSSRVYRYRNNEFSTFCHVGGSCMPGKKLVSSRAKAARKRATAKRKRVRKDPKGTKELSSMLSRNDQGYMRNEGWLQLRSQKFYDVGVWTMTVPSSTPYIQTPASSVDLIAIPSLGQLGATTQSSRTKYNILIHRIHSAGYLSGYITEDVASLVLARRSSPEIKMRLQLLLDTQCNGAYETGTGNDGSPYMADVGTTAPVVFVRENMQNLGRWFVLSDQVIHLNFTMAVGMDSVLGTSAACYGFPGKTSWEVDVDLSANPLLIEYNPSINDGNILLRRTNNLCWCTWIDHANEGATNIGAISNTSMIHTFSRVYFKDV